MTSGPSALGEPAPSLVPGVSPHDEVLLERTA